MGTLTWKHDKNFPNSFIHDLYDDGYRTSCWVNRDHGDTWFIRHRDGEWQLGFVTKEEAQAVAAVRYRMGD